MTLFGVRRTVYFRPPGGRNMTSSGKGVPVEVREQLERIVIQLLAIAARPEIDPDLRNELMEMADQISSVLEQ